MELASKVATVGSGGLKDVPCIVKQIAGVHPPKFLHGMAF